MSDRAKKSIGQDLVGALFCLLGGFFAVSIVLHIAGQEPVVPFATSPVLELVTLLGPWAALLLSVGVAALGTWVFLAAQPPAIGRPLGALALAAAGMALVLGAFAWGGSLGDAFPGLVAGVGGRLLGAVLGVVALFLGAVLCMPRASGPTTADLMRPALGSRAELAAGVSQAEAALLGGESRPAPRPAPAPRREESLRPVTVRPVAPETKPKAPAVAPTVVRAAAAPLAPAPAKAAVELPLPAAPAWEQEEELADEAQDEPASTPADEEERALAAELAEALTEDELSEDDFEDSLDEEEEEAEETEEEAPSAPAASAPPSASWEQVGLFDEEATTPAAPAALVTPALAFEEPATTRHEPEQATADDPFAAEPVVPPVRETELRAAQAEMEEEETEDEPEAELEAEPEDEEEELEAELEEELEPAVAVAPTAPVKPAPAPEFTLQPTPASRPEPGGERERWEKLVHDSGLLILEQKRVAVSMLERRFAVDFDTACKVLDELQQAGLIGPYIGGRTREILLSREQWLAQAPQTA